MPLSGESGQEKDARSATTEPAPPEREEVIDKMKRVAQSQQTARIDGMTVDGLTAQTVVQAYDKLSGKKREKFAGLPIKQMICKAYEMAEKGL